MLLQRRFVLSTMAHPPYTPRFKPDAHAERSPGLYAQPDTVVVLRSLQGGDVRLAVNPSQRLVDVQGEVARAFGFAFPEKIARFVKQNGQVVTDLLDYPFTDCKDGEVFSIVIGCPGTHDVIPEAKMRVNFELPTGQTVQMVVASGTRLRDLQPALLRFAGGRLPADMASISSPDARIFDDFNDRPFINARQGDVFTISISPTDDPFFFDLFDRRPPGLT